MIRAMARRRTIAVKGALPAPADLGVDTKRGLVVVPLGVLGRVELWTIPSAGR